MATACDTVEVSTSTRDQIALVDAATDRLLDTLALLDDSRAREPSRLPGWTRGHLLTHIARSADGMGNLFRWARTGIETPMYAEPDGRQADIEAGSGRPAADLVEDVATASARWSQQAREVPEDAWSAAIRRRPHLPPEPAGNLLEGRLFEVEFHHVDLGLGYTFAASPDIVVELALRSTQRRFATAGVAAPFVTLAGGLRLPFPPDAPADAPVIEGGSAQLLGWLTGRDAGADLRRAGALPVVPAWT